MSMYHFYAEIYMNGNRSDGIYKSGSGVVKTSRESHESGWYDEVKKSIAASLGAHSSTSLDRIIVMSLTRV